MMRIVRMLLMQMQLKKALTEREIYLDELKKEGNKENNKKSGFWVEVLLITSLQSRLKFQMMISLSKIK
ncbi:SPBc2 prophage-derived uncharacterized protein yorF [Bacillus subtilis]|nr:SPBc2 prophage-derived uncharacterized protein yorF [Bacillus subtilis]